MTNQHPNMVHSAEARWMFAGQCDDTIRDWFKAPDKSKIAADDEGERVDSYLIFPNSNSVGVKLRGGAKFEIKSLVSAPHPFDFEYGSGRTDQWVKWSLESPQLKPLEAQMDASGRWITVSKTRLLRKFSADNGSHVEVAAKQEPRPNSGCNVELTLLKVTIDAKEQLWFTLGFEAFGPPARLSQILDETLTAFFKTYGVMPEKKLNSRDCFSYPQWLASLI